MGSKRILLVEDDPNFGIVLKDYLGLNDYHVTHAKDGIEGLIMFKNNYMRICPSISRAIRFYIFFNNI